jgi:uncharacterized protein YecE (DUF72 family)
MGHPLHSSYYSGLSGLVLPVPKYQFPPPYQEASRLQYYASFFNSIEINSSFYKVPQYATINKWQLSVPGNFRFTLKLWKQITHIKYLNFEKSDVELFLKAISAAGDKKGCLLVQFPPGLSIDNKLQFDNLLGCIKEVDKDNQWKIAVEFRHKSWYDESVYELINAYDATIVIHDIPKSATPLLDLQSNFIYVRFHGPTGNYRGSYPDELLAEHAGYFNDWLDEGKEVYAYFNNTMGAAFQNLETMNKMIR